MSYLLWQWWGQNMTTAVFIFSKNNVLNCQLNNVRTTQYISNPGSCFVVTYCICIVCVNSLQTMTNVQRIKISGTAALWLFGAWSEQNQWKIRAHLCSSLKITCSLQPLTFQMYSEHYCLPDVLSNCIKVRIWPFILKFSNPISSAKHLKSHA